MSRNRWTTKALAGLLALATGGGCKQQLFMEPGDYTDAVKYGVPKTLESSVQDAILPSVIERIGNGPPTVSDPVRPPKYVTLKECIAIALEQGNVGSQSPSNFGFRSDNLDQFTGRGVVGTDAIRAFALDPAISQADIERSASKFDAQWISSMQWQKVDQPVAAQFLSFQQQRDAASLATTLAKPLPTGGVAGITFSTDYSKFPNQITQQGNFVNPNYTPRVQFVFEQPLLQLYGVEVNQLTNRSPTSSLISGLGSSGGQTTEGILLTRIRYDQTKAEFDRVVNFMLANVETAYWNLYAAYYNLYAQEEGLRQSFDGFRFTKARVDAGTDPPQQENQARAQFEEFRGNVYRARNQVLESERQLRGFLGLRSDDGTRLVPIDEPNLVPYKPDFYEAANDALAYRPELAQARQELKAQQLNLLLQRNLRRPDLRFFSSYDVAGLGTRLDGPEFTGVNGTTQGNAFSSLGNNQFNSWSLGLRMTMPLGFRDANAAVRQSQLNLTKSYFLLRDAELKAIEYIVLQYRNLDNAYRIIEPAQERRKQLQINVYKTKQVIDIGKWTSTDFFNYLQVQRDLATAISQEFRAIADYNSALAQFEFAKGTIARYNNVSVNEGALPPWVQKRAADHIRERTEAAIKLREQPAPVPAGTIGGQEVGPAVGTPFINKLPPFAEKRDPVPEQLPDPRPVDPKGNPMGDPKADPKADPKKNGNGAPNPLPGGEAFQRGNSVVSPNPFSISAPNPGAAPAAPPPFPPMPAPAATGVPPNGYFEPDGRVSVPRRAPVGPGGFDTPRDVGSPAAPPPVEVPPTTPAIPPLPGSTGGIPATLPPIDSAPPGLPTIPQLPGGQ